MTGRSVWEKSNRREDERGEGANPKKKRRGCDGGPLLAVSSGVFAETYQITDDCTRVTLHPMVQRGNKTLVGSMTVRDVVWSETALT